MSVDESRNLNTTQKAQITLRDNIYFPKDNF